MNVTSGSCLRECTSCQMCSAVCPVDAIKFSLNTDGFYRPSVDSSCIDCGKCIIVCYKYDEGIRTTSDDSLRTRYKLYGAYIKDRNVLEECTSGGIADLLAMHLYIAGYSCIGVIYDIKKNIARSICAKNIDDIKQFRGSKYIQAYNVDTFKTLVKNARTQKFAVFGLPCQIYAIDRFLRLVGKRDQCLLIDLFCHGCPSMNLWTKYLNSMVDTNKLQSISFRDKKYGWGIGYNIKFNLKNKEIVSGKIGKDLFFRMFFSDLVLNDSCYNCLTRSTFEYTDIRLGDFWGNIYSSSDSGVSAVVIITKQASEVWEQIKSNTYCEVRSFNELLPYQSWGKTYQIDINLRNQLLSQLIEPNLNIEDIYHSYYKELSLTGKIKLLLKDILFTSPNLVRLIKRMRK